MKQRILVLASVGCLSIGGFIAGNAFAGDDDNPVESRLTATPGVYVAPGSEGEDAAYSFSPLTERAADDLREFVEQGGGYALTQDDIGECVESEAKDIEVTPRCAVILEAKSRGDA